MAKPPRPWIVTKHGPIVKLEDNLWVVEGEVPGVPFHRRMSIIKRADGTLLFFNAIPLDESALAEVLAWGKPAILVVPHDQHMIDARAFSEKLGLEVYGPKECEAKMRARAQISGTLESIPQDPTVRVEPVAGIKNGEASLVVTSANGHTSLLVSDALMNNTRDSVGFLPRTMGFVGHVKIVPVFRMMFLKDKKALKGQLGRWAKMPGLTHLVPCHGDVVSSSVPEAIDSASGTL
jgi:hypothetical protein